MGGFVEAVYVAPRGSAPMRRLAEVRAMAGRGLAGDRYCEGNGYWSRFPGGVCEVTLIEAEALEEIEREFEISVMGGEHRRNIVTRGIRLLDLRRRRFRVGEVLLEYDRTRPPCRHVQELTEPGMTRALRSRGGIGARILEGGVIRQGDVVIPL
ncbi:MOSC domain-containing protein [Rubrobacter calidifluminis]|uniref:MOSC domain-containing protein n=1 Tax=Rubrobacter calidifluminis TaxID=1392640 RepID=UPI0023600C4F|nr:MOSC domain-containing protein [Rubrobacter calidifluminis]